MTAYALLAQMCLKLFQSQNLDVFPLPASHPLVTELVTLLGKGPFHFSFIDIRPIYRMPQPQPSSLSFVVAYKALQLSLFVTLLYS